MVVETGTSSFGMLEAQLPARSRFVAQILWGSIGWSVGATLGVALAARERGLGRTCLFVGDGSLQLVSAAPNPHPAPLCATDAIALHCFALHCTALHCRRCRRSAP